MADTKISALSAGTAAPGDEIPVNRAGSNFKITAGDILKINGGTITANSPVLDLTQTWNNAAVTFTGLKFNVPTDSSASGSLLMDLQVGGTSRFRFGKDGRILGSGNQTVDMPTGNSGVGINGGSTGNSRVSIYGNTSIQGTLNIVSTGPINWSSSSTDAYSTDLSVFRDAADTLAQRRGTNAQTFRIYNTFTDASNYERGKFAWSSNVLQIGTEKAGTGTARALELQTDGTTRVTISTAGVVTLNSNDLVLTGNNAIAWSSKGFIKQPTDGNWSISSFNYIQLGGTTSSFPALKRSSATLICRLADDTANAAFEAASLKTDAPAGGTAATWKLGAVATVSPTSPNRTIEVDIGGTIYYLHAKTTND